MFSVKLLKWYSSQNSGDIDVFSQKFSQKYDCAEQTEHTGGQKTNGLCHRSGLRSFYWYLDGLDGI